MATETETTSPVETTQMDDFSDEFKALTLSGFSKRPDKGGSLGRPMPVLVNLYPVKLKNQNLLVHHYDVQILAAFSPKPGPARPAKDKSGAKGQSEERVRPVRENNLIWDQLSQQHNSLAPTLSKTAFDGRKNAFTPAKFPFETTQTFKVNLPSHSPGGRPREFDVKIAHAQTIDMSVLSDWINRRGGDLASQVATAIQAIDVLLRHDLFRKSNVISASQGRKFFDTANGMTPIGEGAHVLKGLFASIRPTVGGLVSNIDTVYSPYLIHGSLERVMFEATGRATGGRGGAPSGRGGNRGGRGGRGGGRGGYGGASGASGAPSGEAFNDREKRHLLWLFTGKKVRLTHRVSTREYTIAGFGQPANVQSFEVTEGPKPEKATAVQRAQAAAAGQRLPADAAAPSRKVTVAAYFKEKYNKTLQFPSLQVVQLSSREYVPIECLELLPIQGGIPPTRLSGEQAASMIKVAAKRPEDRQRLIDVERGNVGYNDNSRISSWGITVEQKMKQINGRVLPPPKVQYHPAGKVKEPSVGRGQWNLVDTKFVGVNKPLERWGVCCFESEQYLPRQALQGLLTKLVKQMKDRGMAVRNERPHITYGNADKTASVKDLARQIVNANPKKEPPQLMIFILRDPKDYDEVKITATMGLPVPVASQVLLGKNLRKEDRQLDQYFGNVCMKLNQKLFGSNWIIDARDLPKLTAKTLMLGADVTHPPAARGGEAIAPSVAAVVGTHGGSGQTYSTQVRTQQGRQEIISDLQSMCKALILKWKNANKGVLPENIIFFRDGVSEGQYGTVVENEVEALKKACREFDLSYKPKLTYVVCAKRHHVRFFATNDQNRDKSGNLPAGLVVDTDVVHPFIWDFYLQSQAGLVGTCRPTHYICLLDENGFTSDTMERLVNSLCYSFARATRSVSIVPVAYYADIVCTKARTYAYLDDSASSIGGSNTEAALSDPMFIQNKLDRGIETGHHFPGGWFM
ncbi:Piwi-domain-containing protein [Meredithblackwellia eburnea MCA 4105]